MENFLLLCLVAAIGIIAVVASYYKMKNETPERKVSQGYDMDTLLVRIKYKLADLTKETDDIYALDDEEYDAIYARRNRILMAMRNCVYGIDSAKIIVKELIREELALALPEEEDILNVINFKDKYLSERIKFEIILYFYKKKYGKNALPKFLAEHNLVRLRELSRDDKELGYYIDSEDINVAYRKLDYDLSYDQMLDVLTVLMYQSYRGFGLIDTIREMNINGLNCGTYGSVLSKVSSGMQENMQDHIDATRSVGIQHDGKYIHLRFLDFESVDEIKRITNLIIRYNSPGALTEKMPFKVNTMYDKTRVMAMRPSMGEYWAFFLRKFTLSNNSLNFLLNPTKLIKDAEGKTVKIFLNKNTQLPEKTAMWFMRGKVTTAVTGRQSSGKTTTMKSLVQYISPQLNIRVLEMAPEMYLRELYPFRNIFEAQETAWATTTQIQDAFKKSDAAVTIVGEVATAEMAARMIEAAKVASEMTMFSHHAKTTQNLVQMLRNNLVSVVPGTPANVAEGLVVDAVPVDYHQDFDEQGRFIARVTEIIPLDEGVPYPDIRLNNPLLSVAEILREYAMRRTDRTSFICRDLLRFDRIERAYYPAHLWSAGLIEHIISNLPPTEIEEFQRFIKDNWCNKAA